MARNFKTIYADEVAMMEHELVQECHPMELDMNNQNWMYYFSGIHDMAQKIMEKIEKGDGY